MDQRWVTQERRLWDALMNPVPEQGRWLAQAKRRLRHMPPGKPRVDLQKEVTQLEAARFASGWRVFDTFVGHTPV